MISQVLFPLIFTFIKRKIINWNSTPQKVFQKLITSKEELIDIIIPTPIKESQNPDFFNRRIKKFPQISSSDPISNKIVSNGYKM